MVNNMKKTIVGIVASAAFLMGSLTGCSTGYKYTDKDLEGLTKEQREGVLKGDVSAILYTETSYGGAQYAVIDCRGYSGFPESINDEISSVRVFNAAEIRLWEHANYKGDSIIISSNAYCLHCDGYNFNDRASSVDVVSCTN